MGRQGFCLCLELVKIIPYLLRYATRAGKYKPTSACPVFSPYVARLFLSGLNRIKQVSLLWAYLRILASLTHESTLDNLSSDNLLNVVRVYVASRAYKGFKQKPDLCIYYTFLGDFEYIILCNNITVFEKKYTRGF